MQTKGEKQQSRKLGEKFVFEYPQEIYTLYSTFLPLRIKEELYQQEEDDSKEARKKVYRESEEILDMVQDLKKQSENKFRGIEDRLHGMEDGMKDMLRGMEDKMDNLASLFKKLSRDKR